MAIAKEIKLAILLILAISCTSCTNCRYDTYTSPLCCNTCTDDDITTAVRVQMNRNRCLSYQDIEVSTYERVVTLRGSVEGPTQQRIAYHLASCVPCVKGVNMYLKNKHCLRYY